MATASYPHLRALKSLVFLSSFGITQISVDLQPNTSIVTVLERQQHTKWTTNSRKTQSLSGDCFGRPELPRPRPTLRPKILLPTARSNPHSQPQIPSRARRTPRNQHQHQSTVTRPHQVAKITGPVAQGTSTAVASAKMKLSSRGSRSPEILPRSGSKSYLSSGCSSALELREF